MKPKFLVITLLLIFVSVLSSYSQPKPPAKHANNVNTTPNQSAPIGTATGLLLGLGAGYTAFKVYQKKKEKE